MRKTVFDLDNEMKLLASFLSASFCEEKKKYEALVPSEMIHRFFSFYLSLLVQW
ncbi:hypothetical protein C1H46_021130 [Malus baccata]|uniref:Uncharacterized protein n=1 Tax=Malus baccata TaxID=106549 RepID=A0A540M3A4_MALBA|nr:hypothetical protein C1H46_021130 [Malus baccata]